MSPNLPLMELKKVELPVKYPILVPDFNELLLHQVLDDRRGGSRSSVPKPCLRGCLEHSRNTSVPFKIKLSLLFKGKNCYPLAAFICLIVKSFNISKYLPEYGYDHWSSAAISPNYCI